MQYGKMLLLGLILARAVYTDVRTGKIENRLAGAGLAMGLLLNLAAGGGQGIRESLRASVLVLAGLFALFLVRGLGAGDIKLLAAVAAFLPQAAFRCVAASFVAGAVLSLGRIMFRWLKRRGMRRSGRSEGTLFRWQKRRGMRQSVRLEGTLYRWQKRRGMRRSGRSEGTPADGQDAGELRRKEMAALPDVLADGQDRGSDRGKDGVYVRGETIHFSVAIALGTLWVCLGGSI